MALGGTKVFCPHCESFQICAAVPLYKLQKPKGRRWHYTEHIDIQWFRRARQCLSCHSTFLTEIEEAFIDELIELRGRLARKQRQDVEQVKKKAPWIIRTETVPHGIAERFVERSAWWLTHSSGWPVRAPRHADRIYESHHGWVIDFGANSFLVGVAIERCKGEVNGYLDLLMSGKIPLLTELKRALQQHISGAVANSNGYEYTGYYPINDGRLVFGAQAIDVSDGAD